MFELINMKTLFKTMTDVFTEDTTSESAFRLFTNYLIDARYRGTMTLDDKGYIRFHHDKRIEDYIKSPSWIIKIHDGSQISNSTPYADIEAKLDEDEEAIKYLLKQINELVLTKKHRTFFWKRFILKEKRESIVAEFNIYKDIYYEWSLMIKNVVSHAWCLEPGNAEIYIEYIHNLEKSLIM